MNRHVYPSKLNKKSYVMQNMTRLYDNCNGKKTNFLKGIYVKVARKAMHLYLWLNKVFHCPK